MPVDSISHLQFPKCFSVYINSWFNTSKSPALTGDLPYYWLLKTSHIVIPKLFCYIWTPLINVTWQSTRCITDEKRRWYFQLRFKSAASRTDSCRCKFVHYAFASPLKYSVQELVAADPLFYFPISR